MIRDAMTIRRREWVRSFGLFLVCISSLALAQSGPTGWTDAAPADILAGMTLEEKVGQLFIVYHSPPEFLAEHGFGGTLVFSSMVREPNQLRTSLAEAQRRCRIPLLVAMDQEGGKVNRLASWPGLGQVASAREMAAMTSDQVDSAVTGSAAALLDLGVNTNLAPVVDPAVDHQGRMTLMGQRDRAFGNNSSEIVPAARAFLHSYARRGIGGIVKHYPGYNVLENSDEELAISHAGPADIAAMETAFQEVMPGALGVMMSSIRFVEISPSPAVLDPGWVGRARCGYHERIVMTDDLWGGALRAWVSGVHEVEPGDYPAEDLRRLVLLAFDAGNDMLMVTFPRKAVEMKAVLVEVIAGDPERQRELDTRVRRILRAKADLGLLGR